MFKLSLQASQLDMHTLQEEPMIETQCCTMHAALEVTSSIKHSRSIYIPLDNITPARLLEAVPCRCLPAPKLLLLLTLP
jgi:hypothetical protein